MKSSSKLACFRCMTLVGGFLLMTPSVIGWYWGNLSVYTDSYVRARLGPESGFQTPWAISCCMIGEPIGFIMSDILRKYFGTHGTPLMGCLAYNLTLGMSYFTIQQSVVLFEIILGFAIGWSFGLIFSHALWIVREWCSSEHVGFYSGLVTGGGGLGPLLITQLITWFINPDNKIPDLRTGDRAFFTQEKILNRIPSIFLVLCGVDLSCHLVGIFLIRDTKYVALLQEETRLKTCGQPISKGNASVTKSCYISDGPTLTVYPENGQSYSQNNARQNTLEIKDAPDSFMLDCPCQLSEYNRAADEVSKGKSCLVDRCAAERQTFRKSAMIDSARIDVTLQYKSTEGNRNHDILDGHHTANDESIENPGWVTEEKRVVDVRQSETKSYRAISDSRDGMRENNSRESPADDKLELQAYQKPNPASCETERNTGVPSPWEIFKTPVFYILGLCALCNDLSVLLTSNYYKAYGQLHIKDDHFLADVSSIMMFGYIITRALWGLMVDYLGVKNTLIFFTAGLALGMAFWYFTVLVDKWFYLIWTVMVGTLNGGFYLVFAMCSLKLFGHRYYTRNIGLIMAATVPFSLASPHIVGHILRHSGYFTLFFTSSCLSTVGQLLIILFIPGKEVN